MLKLLATYFLTLLTTLTFAQSFDTFIDTFKVSGTINSSNTGNPITDGLILISRTKGYRPDSLGNFTLYGLSKGRHKITFSGPGYNSQDTVITISNNDISNFSWTIYTTALGKRIDSLFTSYLDSSLAGVVLLAEKNEVTFKKAYGYANNESKQVNTVGTLFNVASIGKQFTVYGVLLLEKKGLLSTNDLLTKYIGAFNDARDNITIHQLLIHRSGLIKGGIELDYSTRSKFIESIKKGAIDSIPGKKYRYTNAGYSMLAAVVEIVSGQPFEQYLYENIFKPCKMQNTGYPWEQRINKNLLATGYNNKHQPMPVQENIWAARGPGNLVTSMDDLFKWMKAFQDDKFLPAAMRNKILFEYYPGEDGYAWNKTRTAHNTRFYHKGGGRPDFESRLMWFPDDGVILIFSLNNDYDLARQLFTKARAIIE